ncbi:hypothetical protein O3Q51_06000 [Cryomorphaceae bacterium 1068]|nr:hypothetical protein [Cryomorphaceae bacterium 1068]
MTEIKIFFDEGQKFEPRNIKPLVGIAGLYFIFNNEIKVHYPFDKSRLIYIGMSEKKTNSIGKRLQGHLEGTSGNEGIVSYGKVNSLYFTYINFEMLKRMWPLSIENLESYFILDFVKRYGVYPICNNKSGHHILQSDLNSVLTVDWKYFE